MIIQKSGIYRAAGKKMELLLNVVGESPCFRIISAINLTETMRTGKFVTIDEESDEIQEIYNDPKSFVFFELDTISDFLFLNKKESPIGVKLPEITKDSFSDLLRVYKKETSIPGRGEAAVKMHIMRTYTFNEPQAKLVIRRLRKASFEE